MDLKFSKLNSILIPLGFNKKGNNYFLTKNNLIYNVNLQKSNFSDLYYLNCFIYYKDKKSALSFRLINKSFETQKDLFDIDNGQHQINIVSELNERFLALIDKLNTDNDIRNFILSKPGVVVNKFFKDAVGIDSEDIVF